MTAVQDYGRHYRRRHYQRLVAAGVIPIRLGVRNVSVKTWAANVRREADTLAALIKPDPPHVIEYRQYLLHHLTDDLQENP
jgi:hypothetical protein